MGTTRSLQDQEKREYKWNKRAGIMQISSQNTNNKNFLTTVKSNSENITVGKKKQIQGHQFICYFPTDLQLWYSQQNYKTSTEG